MAGGDLKTAQFEQALRAAHAQSVAPQTIGVECRQAMLQLESSGWSRVVLVAAGTLMILLIIRPPFATTTVTDSRRPWRATSGTAWLAVLAIVVLASVLSFMLPLLFT
jgi:hypothetical protein